MLTALLLLLLLSAMTVAMVMSVRGDILVNGYYRNNRGAFYAADSGLNIGRQALYSQLQTDIAALGSTYNPTSGPPLTVGSSGEDQTMANSVTSNYGSWQNISGSGQGSYAANSWPAQFRVSSATVTPVSLDIACANSSGTPTNCTGMTTAFVQCSNLPNSAGTSEVLTCPFSVPSGFPTNGVIYNYLYQYSLTAQGRTSSVSNQTETLSDTGYFLVTSQSNVSTSFASYGMFINSQTACSSGDLVPGTLSGPIFTNGAWTFGTSGSYLFTDSVGQAAAQAGFDFGNGNCVQAAAGQDTSGGNSIKPTYNSGTLNLGQATVPAPLNSLSQEQAVVDGIGTSSFSQSSPGNLKSLGGTAFPTSGTVPNGVYLSYTGTDSGALPTAVFTGGGLLVQGDATVTLTSGSGSSQQYKITQTNGSTVTTTTVTVTPSITGIPGAGTTTISQQVGSGSASNYTINSVPTIQNSNGSYSDAMMVYVNGNITSLTGPSSGAAIQNGADVTVTAADNITITGNITYATEPVTMPGDTLTSNSGQAGVLGIYTGGSGCTAGSGCGNINLQYPTSGQNWEIDASLATISANGSGGVVNTGNSINTLTIVGGRIQNTIQNIGATTRNVYFDRRFTTISPPWFPTTTSQPGVFKTSSTIQRTSWINNSGQF